MLRQEQPLRSRQAWKLDHVPYLNDLLARHGYLGRDSARTFVAETP
jgi:hypothetical protein